MVNLSDKKIFWSIFFVLSGVVLFACDEEVLGRGSDKNYFFHKDGFFLFFSNVRQVYKIPYDGFLGVDSELVYKDDHAVERVTVKLTEGWLIRSYPEYKVIKIFNQDGLQSTVHVSSQK